MTGGFLGRLIGGKPAGEIITEPEAPVVQNVETAQESTEYWTEHNVTLHRQYASAAESLAYFHWRNDQYFNYLPLMPVAGFDGKTVLDFGCGPGHDLVGFGHYSKPARLTGADVSSTSLAEARDRLAVHGFANELVRLESPSARLPFEDASIDHVHSSGVLHHTSDPVALLKELRRVLKPDGTANIMVYNYDSLWVHLYVAYVKQIVEGQFPGEDIRSAFRHTTDGPDCPISNVYKPHEWLALCEAAGFTGVFSGAGVSLWECSLAPRRFDACMSETLPEESRRFLLDLSFDNHGMPMHDGHYAGIDGCFNLRPA